LFLLLTAGAWGQQADIPKSFTPPTSDYDYEKREVMIPCGMGSSSISAVEASAVWLPLVDDVRGRWMQFRV